LCALRTAVYVNRTYGGVRGAPHQRQLVGPSTRLAVRASLSVKCFSFQLSKIYGLCQGTLRKIHCLQNNQLHILYPERA
jgi:hypothetical protein